MFYVFYCMGFLKSCFVFFFSFPHLTTTAVDVCGCKSCLTVKVVSSFSVEVFFFFSSGFSLKIVLALLRNITPLLQDLWAHLAILPQQNPVVYFKTLPGPLHTAVAWSRSTLVGPKQIKWSQSKPVQKQVSPVFSGGGLDQACFLSSSLILSLAVWERHGDHYVCPYIWPEAFKMSIVPLLGLFCLAHSLLLFLPPPLFF